MRYAKELADRIESNPSLDGYDFVVDQVDCALIVAALHLAVADDWFATTGRTASTPSGFTQAGEEQATDQIRIARRVWREACEKADSGPTTGDMR
jgi:hypothetical protein